jgi:hypothetical protein
VTPKRSQTRALVLDLTSNGVAPEVARTLSDVVAAAVVRQPGLIVTAGADIRARLQAEGTKQAAGCDSSLDSCMAELAGALDADLVVSGSVGFLGDVTIVSVALYDARKQASIGREQAEVTELSHASRAVDAAVARLFGAPPERPFPTGAVVTAAVGAAVLTAGGATALWGALVQGDPKSLGEAKQMGTIALPLGAFIAVGGALASVAGIAFVVLDGTGSEP